jgi:RecA-family ATPase
LLGLVTDLGPGMPDENETAHNQTGSAETSLSFLDLGAWEGQSPPLREWAVIDRVPLRNVTLLSGEGAVGKSIITGQLLVAHALGRDWLDTMPEPGPVLYLNAEDEEEELHRRFARIAAHYESSFSDLAGQLHILSLAGKDAVLGAADRMGLVKPTRLFVHLHKVACSLRPKLIALDTAADIFAGNENDRTQVRQFVGLLRHLAIDGNAAVMVCSHPSLNGLSSGTGLSGSTAWHNSVRARIYMKPVTAPSGDQADPNLRELEFKKNNYGPLAESVIVRWKDGVFVAEHSIVGSLDLLAAERKADDLFLRLLDRFEKQGRRVSHNRGPTYAPALFAKDPEVKSMGVRAPVLGAAMERLFARDEIRVETYGRPSRLCARIVRGSGREVRETAVKLP